MFLKTTETYVLTAMKLVEADHHNRRTYGLAASWSLLLRCDIQREVPKSTSELRVDFLNVRVDVTLVVPKALLNRVRSHRLLIELEMMPIHIKT